MKRWIKIVLWILGTPIIIVGGLLLAYIITNKQGVIEPFQVGNPQAQYKILVASQGSEFKEKLVERIASEFESDSVYISVVDCTDLDQSHTNGWDAYILIHVMQIHKMPKEAREFLNLLDDLSKVFLVSTSGAGDEHFTELEVDGISSPSRMIAIDPIMKWIQPRIKEILSKTSI